MDKHRGVFYLVLLKVFLVVWSPHAFSRECRPRNGSELAELANCDNYIEHDEVTIILSPQTYELEENIAVTQPSAVTIIGNGAKISCTKHAALILCSILMIDISNITISSCGTSLKFGFQVAMAIMILNSSGVTVNGITVKDSFGTGLYLKNCSGKITINNSEFENNSLRDIKQDYGGGGIRIEQMQPLSSSASITISWCNFTNNNASISKFELEKFPVNESNQAYLLFGRGGGLSIYLNTSYVRVTVSRCMFDENTAHRGGALFTFFLQHSSNNSIGITGSTFTKNKCTTQEIPESIYSAGGALAVLYLSNDTLNKFNVSNCSFVENVAYYGGGLSMGTEKNDVYQEDSVFIIENSRFERNNARIGSAMDFFCYSITETSNCHCTVTPMIRNVNLTQNKEFYIYVSNEKGRTFSTLHLQSLTAKFEGDTIIADNEASGIRLETAVMEMCANASITLQNNSGRMGGGIVALGESQIYLRYSTTLNLIANMASEQGGGMYIEQPEKFFSIYLYSCFMRYEKMIEPSKWEVNVKFEGNRANGKDNAIFTSSVRPCVWPRQGNGTSLSEDIFSTFCKWKVFNFSGKNCTGLIQTLPNNFTKDEYVVQLYPYNRTKIEGFGVLDDLGHDVTNNSLFTTCLVSHNHAMNVSAPEPDLNSVGLLISEMHGSYKMLVQTAYHRSISTIVKVEVLECPEGYSVRKNKGCTCIMDQRVQAILRCNDTALELNVFIGHCAGVSSGQLLYSKCPFTANYFRPTSPVRSNASQFNDKFCMQHGRTGFLCSNCRDNNHGIDIFSPSYKCIPCNHSSSYANWIKAVSVVIGPQTLFFLIVVIFNIGITAPAMTGYIFFSHVLTLPLETLIIQSAWSLHLNTTGHSPRILTDVLLDPYRVWNFDYPEIFHVKACLYGSLKIMHAIAFRYIHALYPIVLLAVTLLFIELHARNCKPVVYMWKPLCFLCVRFRRNWEVKTSVIDAFATVILLSYSKVINTSLHLLTRNFVFNYTGEHVETRLDYDTSVLYFKGQHIIFASVAIVMLSTFGLIPPLLLMLYPNRLFFKLLTKLKLDRWHGLHVFVETFHGSFKNRTNGCPERRWFAGIYFIFRVIVFMIFAFTEEIIRLHLHLVFTYTAFLLLLIILRPYKRNFYTCLDASFLAILIVTNASIVYGASQVQLNGKLPTDVWKLTYAILWIPTVYLALYVIYLVCARSRSRFIQRYCLSNVRRFKNTAIMYFANTPQQLRKSLLTSNNLSDPSCNINSDQPTHSSLDDFSRTPDRVDNPQRYYNMEWSNNFGTSCSVITVDREKDREELRSKGVQ